MNQPPQRIGWIGAGVMGAAMAGHLIDAGHSLTIFTRTRSKAQPLLDRGSKWADSPRDVAHQSDIVFSIVGNPDDVREVHLGHSGTLTAPTCPRLLVDMTTSQPSLAIELHEAAAKRSIGSLDAPVSGGDVGARNATLSIMVGGHEEDFRATLPLLQRLGKTIVHHGPAGAGQHAKMVNQILIASNMVGVCEGLIYAERCGLNAERVLTSVSSGAAGSWSLSNLAPRAIAGDFEPGFYIEHFVKDLGIALDEADRMGLALPGLELAARLYRRLVEMGHSRRGSQALLLAVRAMQAGA